MSRYMRLSRNPYGITTLMLCGPDFDLELKLVSRLGKRERRAVVRGFLSQIKPWLKYFREGAIDHPNCAIIRSSRAIKRGVVLDQSEPISTPSGALGYEIRTKRLRLGISQANLARDLGLSRTHLSALERGLYTPQMKTWQKVQTFLSRPVPGFDADVGNMSEMLDIIPSSPILNLSLNHPHRWLS